ncbi:hypothetical protein GIB67_028312 [Kingdonia uniflora]|uniref:Protein COFACTOR ASSEMBLY OF COMPLEX C SUBUNIT B CCB2, chloroplastic n=1 Tax=Kingdonia uniflora TaxID=39325 RepID=A0A7J7MI09_9MAGN|nr:hypothetical protein GIB67_028312 [Kingdonia uniflora]
MLFLPKETREKEMKSLILNPLIIPFEFRAKLSSRKRNLTLISSRLKDFKEPNQQQQLNLSVLRFTLGIRGLDESYLPRWIGYSFGSLVLLNHFFGSSSSPTSAQLRSEALGLSLAAFSIAVPYLGKFLKGATLVDQPSLPEGNMQIFVMSEHLSETQKEDLAWGTYVLLKNTNAISVLISSDDSLCVRGYWSLPEDVSKPQMLDWFKRQIHQIGFSDLKDLLYFPQSADSGVWEMLPKGTRSLLVQPVPGSLNQSDSDTKKNNGGFILLASSMSYAYPDRDRAWIGAVASKFRGMNIST